MSFHVGQIVLSRTTRQPYRLTERVPADLNCEAYWRADYAGTRKHFDYSTMPSYYVFIDAEIMPLEEEAGRLLAS